VDVLMIPAALVGRGQERATLDRMLSEVRDGASRSLVIRGDPGMGKSALVDYAAAAAAGFLVIRVTGIESEMEFAFAALQQACAPLLKHLDQLPAPQADALRVAFGLRSAENPPAGRAEPPDRFLVGLGVLALAAEEAAAQPLLCIVDDAQWVDQTSLQALAVAGRRLYGESVGLIFTARSGTILGELAGFPELTLAGLPERDARTLLATVVPDRLDERVRDRILAEAAGNPLAIVEFSREITAAGELAGGFGVSPWITRPLADRVAERYLARVTGLPPATRRLLLVAAAEPLGDPALLRLASMRLGLRLDDLAAAEAAGLVRLDAHVTFRHPLVRSAIYRSAPAADRHAAHAALAEATDPDVDADRRAWHRAQATFGPDEEAATDLERSANRALGRGGPAAAAAFLERAAALSPEPSERARRSLAAAQPRYDAGALGEAARLLAAARTGPLDELQRARTDQLAARIASVTGAAGDAPRLLLSAAARLAPRDPRLARQAYLDALTSAMIMPGGTSWQDAGRAARGAPPPPGPPQADDLLLDGMAAQAADGYEAGLPALRDALRAIAAVAAGPPGVALVRTLWSGCRVAMNLWDDESIVVLAGRLVTAARGAGAILELPGAFAMAATASLLTGDLAAAAFYVEQNDSARAVTRSIAAPHGRLALAAWRGQADSAAAGGLGDGTAPDDSDRLDADGADRAASLGVSAYVTALLCNGLGRYQEAADAAETVTERVDQLGYTLWALPELAEAAARCGNAALAARAVTLLERTALPSGTEWALGMLARCRALTYDGDQAEELYQEAITRLGRTRVTPQLARARLLYGEWLRREKRRIDARAELRAAGEAFSAMGARGFARRADRELAATGERVRKRDVSPVTDLTAQEEQIARLVADGQSNPEIAIALFISPRTVEYHLHKIFAKLDITGRGQLARALPVR
jgi:DNA-binding CsgD family transcriptional regulator